MCGRYRLSRRKQLVEEHFDAAWGESEWNPRYNIAPTQPVPVIRQNPTQPRRELSLMRWGLIPSWAKDMSGAAMMINARSETPSITCLSTASHTPARLRVRALQLVLPPSARFANRQQPAKSQP